MPQSTVIKPATTYSAIVGRILQKKRADKGWSQSNLAKEVGLTQGAWSRIENGSSIVALDQLYAAAKCLGESPASIIELADAAEVELRSQGMSVEAAKQTSHGTAMITGAALGALLAAILLKGK